MTHFNPTEPPIAWHQREASGLVTIVALALFFCAIALWADFVSSFVEWTS